MYRDALELNKSIDFDISNNRPVQCTVYQTRPSFNLKSRSHYTTFYVYWYIFSYPAGLIFNMTYLLEL